MARSTYIYIVKWRDQLSAYTVKHEMLTMLREMPRDPNGELKIYRVRDGKLGSAVEFNRMELL